MTNLQKTINQAIPVYFNEDDFNKFILPHLCTGAWGPKTNKENPRNRKKSKRGRKRFFDKELYAQRYKCERTFAWQNKFRRVLVQYEWYQHLFLGFNLLAFTLINPRHIH